MPFMKYLILIVFFYSQGYSQTIIPQETFVSVLQNNGQMGFEKFIDSCARLDNIECLYNKYIIYKEKHNTDSSALILSKLATYKANRIDDPNKRVIAIKNSLGLLYFEGREVPKDYYKSYVWFLVYNESKKNYAAIIQEKNIERIKYVIKKLNKRQLRESIIDAEKANETALKNLDKLYIVE
jgi:hypothetical protein